MYVTGSFLFTDVLKIVGIICLILKQSISKLESNKFYMQCVQNKYVLGILTQGMV